MRLWVRRFIILVSMSLFTLAVHAFESTALQRLECGIIEPQPAFIFAAKKQTITILMIGSSSTSGVGAGDKSKAYPARTNFHLNAQSREPNIRVIAKGIGGERAKAALQRLPTAISETSPDLAVWQVGTNDALGRVPIEELKATVLEGLQIVHDQNLPLILIDPQFFPRILNNQNYTNTVNLIAKIGEGHNLPVVKRYQRMKHALSLDENLMTALMAKDRFHMSALGHECLALDLAATIRPSAVATSVKE